MLENDCVIVPGLGGFVAHYTPAMRVAEENLFLPPTRIVGFNPQLKMNDGLLVQSYMEAYGTNFPDATRMVEKAVARLLACLHEEGKTDLPNIGELRYSIHDTYAFVPYDHQIRTPYLYGLDSFELQELAERQAHNPSRQIPLVPATGTEVQKPTPKVGLRSAYWTGIAAMIAVIALFFSMSTPIENTEVVETNYAKLLPDEWLGQMEKQSLAFTSITVYPQNRPQKKNAATPRKATVSAKRKNITPVAVKEVKVRRQQPTEEPKQQAEKPKQQQPATPENAGQQPASSAYHIIVASMGTEKDARAMAQQLVSQGFTDAKAIIGDGKMRVSIRSCATQAEAYRALSEIRSNESYQNAWVLKK